ncbi:MAG: NYN domain-containing protein [Phycisphaerales bacterium]|nr:NYN domain-containing protein [Phycisphaerales bacterium]
MSYVWAVNQFKDRQIQRVIAYIDGFNLYYGLRTSRWRKYYWLDIPLFARQLARSHQTLVGVKYFTSRVNGPPDKVQRQSVYLDALASRGGLEMFFGHYRSHTYYCERCCKSRVENGEKKTDVNIATQLLLDCVDDRFDVAIVVSGDGDLLAPILAVPRRFPPKSVWMAFPPNRPNRELEAAAGGKVRIRQYMLAQSQLPDEIPISSSLTLRRPLDWRDPPGRPI